MERRLGNPRSENLLLLAVLFLILGVLFFYIGERNILDYPQSAQFHKGVSLVGQVTIFIANATLVIASVCFALENRRERWERLSRLMMSIVKNTTIIVVIGVGFYLIWAILARSLITVTYLLVLIILGIIVLLFPRLVIRRPPRRQ